MTLSFSISYIHHREKWAGERERKWGQGRERTKESGERERERERDEGEREREGRENVSEDLDELLAAENGGALLDVELGHVTSLEARLISHLW